VFWSYADVLTLLTNLDVEILAEESSTEEERQAALRQVRGASSSHTYTTTPYMC